MKLTQSILLQGLALLLAAGCTSEKSATIEFGPILTGLSVSGTKSDLNPAFSLYTYRYSVVADDAAMGLAITPSAPDSIMISINGVLALNNTPFVLDPFTSGQTIAVTVQNEAGTTVLYEIEYLPADFPELMVTTLESGVSPGLVYLSLRGPTSTYAAAVDNNGVPAFYRREDRPISDFKRHPNGERSYALTTTMRTSLDRTVSEQVVFDANFEEIRRAQTVGLEHTDHHEFLIQENGNSILLAYEPAVRDLTAFGGAVDGLVEDSVIQEIDKNGQVVYEWNSWGRISYADELRGRPYDYAHINSIFVDFDSNLIVSARGTSQVSKIDKSSGVLLWTFGGKSNQFTFINDPYQNICGQHTASRLENGNLLIFDNGQYCWPEVAERGELTRIVEYILDESNFTAELVWSYSQDDVYTRAGGSAQRLENGNTLIGWNRGPDILATEVDQGGNKVFEIQGNVDGVFVRSYRAWRFPE